VARLKTLLNFKRGTYLPAKTGNRVRLEMIPLMDCVFLLLVYFIYAVVSLTRHQVIELELPSSSTSVMEREGYLALGITGEGRILWEQREVSLEELPALLQSQRERAPQLRVYLFADRKTHYEDLIAVLDVLRQEGMANIWLETRPRGAR